MIQIWSIPTAVALSFVYLSSWVATIKCCTVCLLCHQFSLSLGSVVDKVLLKISCCLQLIYCKRELKENVYHIYSASVFTVYLRGRNVADIKSLQLTKHTFYPWLLLVTGQGDVGLTRSKRGRKWAKRRRGIRSEARVARDGGSELITEKKYAVIISHADSKPRCCHLISM